MPKRNTSLKDMAAQLGVSIATVSRALQDNPAISEATRKRVQALAREMDYTPNFLAQSFRTDSIPFIGVIVPHGVTLFYSSVLDGIETIAAQEGFAVIIMNSHESVEEERYNLQNLLNLHVAGIIVSVTQETTDHSHFIDAADRGIPIVCVARAIPDKRFQSVVADGAEAAYKATKHLYEQGCRRIALLGGPNELTMVRERKHGYIEALHDFKLPVTPELVSCKTFDVEQAIENTTHLLSLPTPPDAILALNDTLLFGAMKAIKAHGLRIPEDIALIGFTTVEYAEDITPALSAIEDQSHKMGQTACQMLIDQIKNKNTNTPKLQKKVVPTIIKIRESSLYGRGKN